MFSLVLKRTIWTLIAIASFSTALQAQTIDAALYDYKEGNFAVAAKKFYHVFATSSNPDYRDQAEVYLADSLLKMELYMPALYYFSDIFKAGVGNRYYVNAIESLLEVRSKLHDHFLVPTLINAFYSPEGYGQLQPEKINEINYLIGSMSYNQGKYQDTQSFLEFIPPEAGVRYYQARYLLGIIATRRGDPQNAIAFFEAITNGIKVDESDPQLHRMWQLATLGLARTYYGIGSYDLAVEWYNKIPRFDSAWFDALYEVSWAHFQQEDHGNTLGAIQSLRSPYFANRHIPEAYLIMATTYFVNCQWDRTRRTIEEFNKTYQPMLEGLKNYLNTPTDNLFSFYNDIVKTGNKKFSPAIAKQVRRTQRFLDFHHLLSHLDWELDLVRKTDTWKRSQLFTDLEAIIQQQQKDLQQGIGNWVRKQLIYQKDALEGFINQASVIEFEVADAEKRWLEAGRNIIKGKRARLPRPDIPSDQWQHWNFENEYWVDELGYYVHAVKSECIEGM